ncbi:MAG: hypothetical protein Q9167_003252 [Letrouitia subvulpina]
MKATFFSVVAALAVSAIALPQPHRSMTMKRSEVNDSELLKRVSNMVDANNKRSDDVTDSVNYITVIFKDDDARPDAYQDEVDAVTDPNARDLNLAFDLILPGVPAVSRTPLKSGKSMRSGLTPLPDLPPAKSVHKSSNPSQRSLNSTRITPKVSKLVPNVSIKKASGPPRKRGRPPKKPIHEVIQEEDIVSLKLSQACKYGEATTILQPAAQEVIDVQKAVAEPKVKKRKRRCSIGQQPKKRTRVIPPAEREKSQTDNVLLPSSSQEVNNRKDTASLIETINEDPQQKGVGSSQHPCVRTLDELKGQKGRGRRRKEREVFDGRSPQSNKDPVLNQCLSIENHVKEHESSDLKTTEEQKHSEAQLAVRKRGRPRKKKDEAEILVNKRQRKPRATVSNSARISETKLAISPNSAAFEELETAQDFPSVQRPKLIKKTRGRPKATGKSPKGAVNYEESAQDREAEPTAWKEQSFEQPAFSKPKPKRRKAIGQQRPRQRPPKSFTTVQMTEDMSLTADKNPLQPLYQVASGVESDQGTRERGIFDDTKPDEQKVLKPAAAPPKRRGRPPKIKVPTENKIPMKPRQTRTAHTNQLDRIEADFQTDSISDKPPASDTQPTQTNSPPASTLPQPKKRGRPKKHLPPSSDPLIASQTQKSKPTRKPRAPMTKNIRQPPPDSVPILTQERAPSDQALVPNTTSALGSELSAALPDKEVHSGGSVLKQVAQDPNLTFDGVNDLEPRDTLRTKRKTEGHVEDLGLRRRAMSEAPARNKGRVAMTAAVAATTASNGLLDASIESPVLPAQEVSDETRGFNHVFQDLDTDAENEAGRAKKRKTDSLAQPRRAMSEVPVSGFKESARKAEKGRDVMARWERLARASGVARKEREPSILAKMGGGRLGGFLRKLGGEEISDELQGILDQVKGVPVEGEGG